MMQVWHMSGAGNDFAVVDIRGRQLPLRELAMDLCRRTGADGFLAVDSSEEADLRIHFYNPDGLRGEMCGNGSRCVCRFAYENGIAPVSMSIQTDAGTVYGQRLDADTYRVRLNCPSVLDPQRLENTAYVELGQPGIPHALTAVPGLDWEQAEALRPLGRALRYDPAFPRGANVTFFHMTGPAEALVLTYERGVEDFTLACGTGCGSLAALLYSQGRLPGGVLTARNRGGTLLVTVTGHDGAVSAIDLEGPTKVLSVFSADDF